MQENGGATHAALFNNIPSRQACIHHIYIVGVGKFVVRAFGKAPKYAILLAVVTD